MRVTIESPYRGNSPEERKRNEAYLVRAMHDSLTRGEFPFASHRLYPGVLNEDIVTERTLGIEAGYAWMEVADAVVFYEDYGWSAGMKKARNHAKRLEKFMARRKIGRNSE